MRFHLIPVSMTKINNRSDSSHWQEWGALLLLVRVQNCAASVEINMAVPEN